MQIDRESQCSSSDESSNETEREQSYSNSICIRLDLEEKWKADIVYNTLIVDKLPKRSQSKLQIDLEGNYLVVKITSNDQKSLMKSANNVFDMCQLSKNCIETVGAYKYQPINSVKRIKEKNNPKKKNGKINC
uniref:Uncharacterized protein n=1 Tax=Meloidogyne enterolobii TaxID=390850 RepID=A0A6V7WHA8_MELEN|nr:unnamed protein product [Meloidogyne enterolobii]